MVGMVERVAMAISGQDQQGWNDLPENDWQRLYGGGKWHDNGRTRDDYREDARQAMRAMKYVDGADEQELIVASNRERVEAVSLSLAWDAIIDAHLAGEG